MKKRQARQQVNPDADTKEYDAYADTNYAVPDGYTGEIEGRQYGEAWVQYIVQNAHYDYNTLDMIVVSPTVFTSAKYDSEEGLSFKVLTSQYDNFIDELENEPYASDREPVFHKNRA